MGFVILILGVALWWEGHLLKRVAPAVREQMGEQRAKGVVTVGILVSILLMVLGYRMAPVIGIWEPAGFLTHINNLLVLIGLYMMTPAPKKGRLLNGMRHPMLAGFSLWAIAHLLVNGDLASIILFGGLLGWSLITPIIINRAEPDWTPQAPGSWAKDGMFLGASVVVLILIGLIHSWLGYYPFGG